MTHLRDTIARALRIAGLIDAEEDPEFSQLTAAQDSFNQMVRSLAGNGLGGGLTPVDFSVPTGEDAVTSVTVEPGSLLQCNLLQASSVTLPANPKNGARVGVVDASRSFNNYHVQVSPNGRSVEGVHSSLTISTNDDNRIWMFCEHSGNWELERDLTLDDDLYWSEDVVDAMTHMLAARLATENGAPISQSLSDLTSEGRATIVRRYGRKARFQSNPAVGVVSPTAVQRQPAI